MVLSLLLLSLLLWYELVLLVAVVKWLVGGGVEEEVVLKVKGVKRRRLMSSFCWATRQEMTMITSTENREMEGTMIACRRVSRY
jgi:hypothetical protein